MAKSPKMTQELGVAVERNPRNQLRPDEFLNQLRGQRGIRRFREMRDNDATVGAIMFTIEQMLRPVPWMFTPSSDTPEAKRAADIVNRSIASLDIPFTEFIADALSMFTYGFSTFEKVYRRDPKTGDILVARLSPRPQWSIERFVTKPNGESFVHIEKCKEGRFTHAAVVSYAVTQNAVDRCIKSMKRENVASVVESTKAQLEQLIGRTGFEIQMATSKQNAMKKTATANYFDTTGVEVFEVEAA